MQATLFQNERALAIDELHAATALYTVRQIVEGLLDRLGPLIGKRIIDPSCGDGAFLVPVIERLCLDLPIDADDELARSVTGWEIHPNAARECRENIVDALTRSGWSSAIATTAAEQIVTNRDFLTEFNANDTPCVFHVVLGNPPYLRLANVPTILATEYRAALPGYAARDLLFAFLDKCATLIAPNGQIALVTADRWLINAGAAELRENVGNAVQLSHLTRLDASTAFYHPKFRRRGTPPRIHPVEVILTAAGRDPNSRPLTSLPTYPDVADDVAPARTLSDIAEVRLAPWLGTPGIFTVDARIAATLPPNALLAAVDTEDLLPNGAVRTGRIFAIRTDRDTEPDASVMTHLNAQLPRMAQRGRRIPTWLPPELVTTFPLDRDMLVVPRIAKALRTHRLPAGVLPISHNLAVVPYSIALEQLLNASESRAWIAARAPRLEGGFMSITTSLLRDLPVPDSLATSDLKVHL